MECELPCATCQENHPTKCLICIAGYSLDFDTKSCMEIRICSSQCLECPFGRYPSRDECKPCNDENCDKCKGQTVTKCSRCKDRYYVDRTDRCAACEIGCKKCKSESVCQRCNSGFTLLAKEDEDEEDGRCVLC